LIDDNFTLKFSVHTQLQPQKSLKSARLIHKRQEAEEDIDQIFTFWLLFQMGPKPTQPLQIPCLVKRSQPNLFQCPLRDLLRNSPNLPEHTLTFHVHY
jgi:hypothetical protein